jgi:hypothetical protein
MMRPANEISKHQDGCGGIVSYLQPFYHFIFDNIGNYLFFQTMTDRDFHDTKVEQVAGNSFYFFFINDIRFMHLDEKTGRQLLFEMTDR